MNSTGAVRVGVIGCGHFGLRHAEIYRALAGARLVGVCDVDAERAAAAAQRFGVRKFGSIAALCGAVDAVSVVVPPDQHAAVTQACLAGGVHVLVEKPFGHSAATATRLAQMAEARDLVLQVGYVERFDPLLQILVAKIPQPDLIECRRISPLPRRGAQIDVVLDLMVHDIDHALRLAGADLCGLATSGQVARGATHDTIEAALEFRNGCRAVLTASYLGFRPERTVRTVADGRAVTADLLQGTVVDGDGPVAVGPREGLSRQLVAFLRAVRRGGKPAVSGHNGARILETAFAILADAAQRPDATGASASSAAV